jgi:hypothetical protein
VLAEVQGFERKDGFMVFLKLVQAFDQDLAGVSCEDSLAFNKKRQRFD